MKKTTIFLLILTTLSLSAHAQKPLKLKSTGIAAALAFDPIPGDALFYAGKPLQGGINTLLGGLGGALFYTGLANSLIFSDCKGPAGEGEKCSPANNVGNVLSMVFGGALYFPSLIWDGVGGLHGVHKHNERVKKQTLTFTPNVGIAPNGGYVGFRIGF